MRIRFFALQREQLGRRDQRLELPDGATIGDAWARLLVEHPVLASATDVVRFARNARYADPSEPLADGDELAVIPPVAGGSTAGPPGPGEPGSGTGRRTDANAGAGARTDATGAVGVRPDATAGALRRPRSSSFRRIELTLLPIDGQLLAELGRTVATSADGAIVYFVGQTRETPGTPAPGQEAEAARHAGQRVEALDYEAFSRMALGVLDEIADEIEERFGVRGLAVVHRTGRVGLGEASVAVAAAAPHRDAAFDACRYAIDELKARAPIWKSERFADGTVWLGAPARGLARRPAPPTSERADADDRSGTSEDAVADDGSAVADGAEDEV